MTSPWLPWSLKRRRQKYRGSQPRAEPTEICDTELIANCRFQQLAGHGEFALLEVVTATSDEQAAARQKLFQRALVQFDRRGYNIQPVIVTTVNPLVLTELRRRAEHDARTLCTSLTVQVNCLPVFMMRHAAKVLNVPLVVLIAPACHLKTREMFWFVHYCEPASK